MFDKKKIAIVSPVFPPYRSGMGNAAYYHAKALADRGHKVTVFTPDYGWVETAGALKINFAVRRIKPLLKYGNAAWVPSLGACLKGFDSVLLEYPFFGGAKAVFAAKKRFNFKLNTFYHMDAAAPGLKGLVFAYSAFMFLPRLVQRSDIVLASTADFALHSQLARHWQKNNPKFQIMPFGVDLANFSPASAGDQAWPAFDIKAGDKVVLFVGGLDRAHAFKGVDYLIRCLEPLKNFSGFKVVVAGKGELKDKYAKQAKDLGLAEKFVFPGGVLAEDLVKLYRRALVTVLPSVSQSEAFGLVLVESMASGTPVIASNLPGVRSVFTDQVSGFRVEPRNEKELLAKIKFMLDNPARAREMGQAGRKLVEAKYDWGVIGERLAKVVL